MFDFVKVFVVLFYKFLKGDRIGIIIDGGGVGVMVSDVVVRFGFKMVELSEEMIKFFEENFLLYVVVGNLIDVVGDIDVERYRIVIEVFMKDLNVDVIVIIVFF